MCGCAGSSFELKIETDSNDAMEIKTEADSNDITEGQHGDTRSTGMFSVCVVRYFLWLHRQRTTDTSRFWVCPPFVICPLAVGPLTPISLDMNISVLS